MKEHKQDKGRYVMAKRSRKLMGPYSEEKQLALPCREAMEPNQGGIVLGKDGNWCFLTHYGTGDWSGRIASLLPVTWLEGWPVIGHPLPGNIGSMKWTGEMPYRDTNKLHIQRSDDFDNENLSPQWEWNYQPRKEMYSLIDRTGWLRLKAYQPLKENELMCAGNIGIQQTGKIRRVEYNNNGETLVGPMLEEPYIWFRSVWGLDGESVYSYSTDGENYTPLGPPYLLAWGNYRGDRIGIYCFNNKGEKGYVDIDYCHYRIEK